MKLKIQTALEYYFPAPSDVLLQLEAGFRPPIAVGWMAPQASTTCSAAT